MIICGNKHASNAQAHGKACRLVPRSSGAAVAQKRRRCLKAARTPTAKVMRAMSILEDSLGLIHKVRCVWEGSVRKDGIWVNPITLQTWRENDIKCNGSGRGAVHKLRHAWLESFGSGSWKVRITRNSCKRSKQISQEHTAGNEKSWGSASAYTWLNRCKWSLQNSARNQRKF